MPETRTTTEVLELVLRAIPFPEQIREIGALDDEGLRFTWRGNRFRVTTALMVEEAKDGMLCGSDLAILLQAVLETKDKEF